MPKVIGIDPSAVNRITCYKCSSILEYTENEKFEKKYGYDYLGDYSVGNFIKCPCCGHDIKVK